MAGRREVVVAREAAVSSYSQELLRLVERLLRAPEGGVRMMQDMSMVKPPGGREKPWHQDHAYFNYPVSPQCSVSASPRACLTDG